MTHSGSTAGHSRNPYYFTRLAFLLFLVLWFQPIQVSANEPAGIEAEIWAEISGLIPVDKISGDGVGELCEQCNFPFDVDISGDSLILGAPGSDENAANGGAAYIFVRSGGTWTLEQTLNPGDPSAEKAFGTTVAIDGNTAVVGAPGDAEEEVGTGAAYVFFRDTTRGVTPWAQQQKLTLPAGNGFAQFGNSVDIEMDTVIVGSPYHLGNGNFNGSVFAFTRTVDTWSLEDSFFPAVGDFDVQFGAAVALSGDFALIGAPGDQGFGLNRGAAYVYMRSGSSWSEDDKFIGSDIGDFEDFGFTVALDSDTAIVGMQEKAGLVGNRQGFAYVFVREADRGAFAWNEQQILEASDASAFDQFGASVAIEGDVAIIGSWANFDDGATYYFTRSGTIWTEQQIIGPTVPNPDSRFGANVAISGDDLLIAAIPPFFARAAERSGTGEIPSAYVFTFGDPDWVEQQQIMEIPSAAGDEFGYSVAMDNDTIVVGTPHDDVNGESSGSAYVFVNSGDWVLQEKLVPGDGDNFEQFGYAVAVQGDIAFIGAIGDDGAEGGSGTVYVYSRSAGVWTFEERIFAGSASFNESFGSSIALDGDTAVIGSFTRDQPGENSAGAAFVFTDSGSGWLEDQELVASDAASFDRFGESVAISGDTILVGASGNDDPTNSGSAYAFVLESVRGDTAWVEEQILLATDVSQNQDRFGVAVAIDGDHALIGAPGDNQDFNDTGSVYYFTRNEGTWTQQQKFTSGTAAASDELGTSISMKGTRALIGAPSVEPQGPPSGQEGGGGGPEGNAGQAYLFERSGSNWTESAKLVAPDGQIGDRFGFSVALFGQTGAIGAPLDDDPQGDIGSAWILGPAFYTIGGTVSGLTGTALVLQNNGGDDLAVPSDGPFTFSTEIQGGTDYNVTVETRPGPMEYCDIANGFGTAQGDVENVTVTCFMQLFRHGFEDDDSR